MKIAIVSDAIYPYNKGGKEKRIFEISTRLAKRGHEVNIYCMKWWKDKKNSRIENGVHLHAISKYYPLYSGSRRSIPEAILFSLACLKLIKEDFDVIDVDQVPFFPALTVKFVCLLKRKRMIATWLEVWGRDYWICYLGRMGNIAYIIEKLSVLMPDKIISISEHTTNKLRNELLSKKDIVTLPVGVDVENIRKIQPSPVKSDVIFTGRLLTHKNVDVLIQSVAIISKTRPDIKCLVIGEGPAKPQLEKSVKVLNLTHNVQFLNFLDDHNQLYALMKSSKVFVLPSVREGFGMVVIEANACGIPVITTGDKDNASKDLIEEGINGYICRPDEEEIAQRISDILKNNSNTEMKKSCVEAASKYSWEKIVNKIEEVYPE